MSTEEELSGEKMLQQAVLELQPDTEQAVAEVDDVTDEDVADAEVSEPTSTEEDRARADGWSSYDEWKAAGHDPRAWRPAEEFNRRGDLLNTPKKKLVGEVEALRRATREQGELLKEQLRLSQQQVEMARRQGFEQARREAAEALAEAQSKKEAAWATGNKQLFEEAAAEEQQARLKAHDATVGQQAPQLQPLEQWAAKSPWYTNGFTQDNKPKTPVVAEFLQHQKAFIEENPQAGVLASVRYAEGILTAKYGDLNAPPKPAEPPARPRAVQVDAGTRAPAKPSPQDAAFDKLSREEQDIVRRMAKATGMDIKSYMKGY